LLRTEFHAFILFAEVSDALLVYFNQLQDKHHTTHAVYVEVEKPKDDHPHTLDSMEPAIKEMQGRKIHEGRVSKRNQEEVPFEYDKNHHNGGYNEHPIYYERQTSVTVYLGASIFGGYNCIICCHEHGGLDLNKDERDHDQLQVLVAADQKKQGKKEEYKLFHLVCEINDLCKRD
jgi:hypothetical protein